jgi:hypothetical protein
VVVSVCQSQVLRADARATYHTSIGGGGRGMSYMGAPSSI